MPKPVRLRERAVTDIQAAADHYLAEAGEPTALRFVDAVEQAVHEVGDSPRIGSPRFAHDLALPDLRAWPLARFPYIVFYVDAGDRVDVWRILHNRRDIPHTLQEP